MSTHTAPRPTPATTRLGVARPPGLVLGGATLLMGLLAGFFFAYSVSVMPGLGRADDRTLVDAMQQINEAVENPVFLLVFLGAPALALAAAIRERHAGAPARWIAAAAVLCGLALLITFAISIPLNDDLAQAGDPARIADMAAVREDYEDPWVAWNIVRTLASTAALGCLVHALLLRARGSALTAGR